MHILSQETDNCPSWISGRERMTVDNSSWSNFTKECCPSWQGSNSEPPAHQLDTHLTEPLRQAIVWTYLLWGKHYITTSNTLYGAISHSWCKHYITSNILCGAIFHSWVLYSNIRHTGAISHPWCKHYTMSDSLCGAISHSWCRHHIASSNTPGGAVSHNAGII